MSIAADRRRAPARLPARRRPARGIPSAPAVRAIRRASRHRHRRTGCARVERCVIGPADPVFGELAETRRGAGAGARHANAESAAASGRGLERERAVENRGDAFADRQSQPQALFTPGRRLIEPPELFENGAAILGRDSRARVDDLQLDGRAPARRRRRAPRCPTACSATHCR